MSLLNSFDTDANIWEVEPQLKIPKVFAELYKNDKSKGKAHSSKIMWAIALLVDNSEANKFRNLPTDEKKLFLAEDYLGDVAFNWDEYAHLIEEYEKFSLSNLERSLYTYELKLEERTNFIKNEQYTLETALALDKIITGTKPIFELISKLRDDINKEKSSGETKGDMEESASEKGEV